MRYRYRGTLRVMMASVLALLIGVAATGIAWAQQAAPSAPPAGAAASPTNDSVLTAMAATAGAIGSFFYIPFKVGIMCPGMALASGGSLAVTGGNKATAEYLLRVGCTGTYFITPAMVRGQEEFHGAGER